jgi:beta-carotene hydroxylase
VKTVLTAPRIAWPTLALLAGALAVWSLGIALGGIAGLLLATLGAYVAFTPMHDAAHRSIARARWVNELAGRLAVIPLFGPFPAIRTIHLTHHKHTNEPDLDPDHWSGRGPRILLPLRWLTQDLHYYALYVRMRRPRAERLESYLTLVLLVAIAIALAATGHGRTVLLGWLLPARLAIGVLAFAFDFLPHRPHTTPARIDRIAATHVFPGPLKYAASLGQSMHRVHHIYPGVPFYRYAAIWRAGHARGPLTQD